MVEAVLYVLGGIILYAGAHHTYLGTARAATGPHLQLAGMYLLLAGFVLTTALAFQTHTISTQVHAAKLSMTMGILLWVALIWYVALHTRCRPLLLLDLLTAAWLVLLIRNSGSAYGLLYADAPGVALTGLFVQQLPALHPAAGSWWTAVKLSTLASLLFCLYAGLRMVATIDKRTGLVMLFGLSILAAAFLADHLLNAPAAHLLYFAPFGFIGFLLVHSLYPTLLRYRGKWMASQPAVIPSLTFEPERTSFAAGLWNVHNAAEETTQTAHAVPEPAAEHAAFAADSSNDKSADTAVTGPAAQDSSPDLSSQANEVRRPPPPRPSRTLQRNLSSLTVISDNLIDLAVYATMVLNRVKRGDADRQVLEMLCQKIRTKAIGTRRIANKLSRPHSAGKDHLL
jgi:hypothetical protein